MMRSRLALAALLPLALAARPIRAQETGLPIGSAAPSAMLQTLDGKPVDLAAVAKGPALVVFWATWCENCEQLLPTLKQTYAKYHRQIAFVGVSVSVSQSLNRVKLHVAKHGVPGVQLYDVRGQAADRWEVPATSHVVVLDRRGRVVYTGLGGTQDLEAAIRKAL